MRQSLSDTYHAAVRALMSDSLLDLSALEQWHTSANLANLANDVNIADSYSLTETRFMEGYAETFAEDAETDPETANYAEFHAMKLTLRGDNNDNMDNYDNNNSSNSPNSPSNSPFVNWYAMTDGQVAELQAIAERNTGRASVMAKGLLCFFHGICYEDEDFVSGTAAPTETRTKRTAMDMADDAVLNVYPNPTDDLLYVELSGVGIANVMLYDLQGRMVTGVHVGTPQPNSSNSQNSPSNLPTLSLKSLPAGIYLLRVTDMEGKEYHRKVVRR